MLKLMTKIEQKIPEGWSVKKLGDIVNTFSGGTPLAGEATYYKNGTIPFIRSGEIYQNYTELFITEKGLRESSAKMVKRGDLLFALYGANSGEVAISQIDGAINQAILCIRPKYDNTDYLNNVFILSKNKILHKYLQGGQGNLSAEIVKSLNFIFPPLVEQEKIAGILSCWDDGIEKLSALIEKKKIQKKALMQQLLTGKHRLKGFSSPWHEVKLGDIAEKITRKNLNQYTNVVTISAQNGFVLQQQFFSKSVAGEDLSSYNLLKCGEFGYNRSYSKGFPMGAIKRLDLFDVAPVSSLYICFSVNEYIDSNFLVNYFDAGLQNYELYKVAQEGARNHGLLNISLHDFFNIKLYIPSDIAEQKAIAEILSKADEEIELLNKKLEAFKQEKKALMQQLLTGKIRVKVN